MPSHSSDRHRRSHSKKHKKSHKRSRKSRDRDSSRSSKDSHKHEEKVVETKKESFYNSPVPTMAMPSASPANIEPQQKEDVTMKTPSEDQSPSKIFIRFSFLKINTNKYFS